MSRTGGINQLVDGRIDWYLELELELVRGLKVVAPAWVPGAIAGSFCGINFVLAAGGL